MIRKYLSLAAVIFWFTVTPGAIPSTPGWYQVPNTGLADVCACTHGFAFACGVMSCSGIFNWSGGMMDTKRNRLIIWGGGHQDYWGNELYAVDFNALATIRLTDPGSTPVVYGYQTCPDAIAGGTQPNSRHTYDGLAYIRHADRLFAYSGALACGFGYPKSDTWTFNFATNTWQKMNPAGTNPKASYGVVCDYDSVSRKVYLHDGENLFSYDFDNNRYTQLSNDNSGISYHMTSILDPKRRKFVILGGGYSWVYDIGAGSNYARQPLTTTGGSVIVDIQYPGLAYDQVREKIVAWNGGNTVYSLDLDAKTWSADTYPNGPGAACVTGTYKRWAYSPSLDCFVLYNTYNTVPENAYTFRFPGSGTRLQAFHRQSSISMNISPNPGNPSTAVTFDLKTKSGIRLQVMDAAGRLIHDVSRNSQAPGRCSINIGAGKWPAGVYTVKLITDHSSTVKKIISL